MLRKLGAVIAASGLVMSLSGVAWAAPSHPNGSTSGWVDDFCKDRDNWEKVEEWTGREINSRAQCVSALRGLSD